MILNLLLLEQVIVIVVCFKLIIAEYKWFKDFNIAKDNIILAQKMF